MTFKSIIGLTALAFGSAAMAGTESSSPIVHYQPTIDITKNPGCGVKRNTAAERIAFNRKLVELYYINFQSDRKNGRNYGWFTHGCIAPESSVLLGAVSPLAKPATRKMRADPNALTGEQRGYFATFPDWQTVPNTLVAVPFDGGAYMRMMYGGHGKDDGKYYTIWETNLILVNDMGQITHFEMWNDTIGMDATTKKAFGKGITDLGLGGYHEATEAFPKSPQ